MDFNAVEVSMSKDGGSRVGDLWLDFVNTLIGCFSRAS